MMNGNSYSNETALLYSDLYFWATLALSHPEDEKSIKDALEILEGISNSLHPDLAVNPAEELKSINGDELIKQLNLLFLQQEHSRLFIGPFSLLAPPYESYYKGKKSLMGDISSEVETFYRYAGMDVSAEFKDAPDHIILETEFLARLCKMEDAAAQNNKAAIQDIQLAFLQKHLLTWIDALQNTLEKTAGNSFYPLVVRVVNKTAKNHYLYLKALI